MKTPQIADSLTRLFHSEKQRLIFWYDADSEFKETLSTLDLEGVTLLRLDETGSMATKIRLELDDPDGKYLIYSPAAEPEQEDDWLLDIKLYSHTFHADRASVILNELGLSQQSLRNFISQRQAFFNKDRQNRLKKWVQAEDADKDLDLKMLAVVVRAEQPHPFNVLMQLYKGFCEDGSCSLNSTPKQWAEIQKLELEEAFWDLMERTFGYRQEKPNLADLLLRLMVTDLSLSLRGELPKSYQHFLLDNPKLAPTAAVCLSNWRSTINHCDTYDVLSWAISQELNSSENLESFEAHQLAEVPTFEAVEMHLCRALRDGLVDGTLNLEELTDIFSMRRDGHWVRSSSAYRKIDYSKAYDALEAVAELMNLRRRYEDGLSFRTAKEMAEAYRSELYRFDQLYRLFIEAADSVELSGGDLLKQVRELVEQAYSGWFLDQMAIAWGRFIKPDKGEGLIGNWRLQGIPNQQDFFLTHVEPLQKENPQGKVYVIISDAFRYEAAEELAAVINQQNRFKANLESQLGVLPSYTGLGMAALLPHQELSFKCGTSDILVDGLPCSSLEQRKKILEGAQGIAVKASDLQAMKQDEGRDFVKNSRVIYVYHNEIDATGDTAISEEKAFQATRTTIEELDALVRLIINKLNGSRVLITADHGFLYQETRPGAAEKSGLSSKPAGTLKAKKRYLLGENLGENENAWHGCLKQTSGANGGMECWIPKGNNLFHFVGGARFVHGGAMLQEVIVPVISIKSLRGKSAEASTVRKVKISQLGSIHKVVNNIQIFKFIQTEAVSSRVLPRTLLASLRDVDRAISNEVVLTFDSESSDMNERVKEARLVVESGTYDKKKEYHLVLRDADTQVEVERYPLSIDLAFTNDF
jgi:uncharacterized protein (TIGR02687 family)